MSTMVLKRKRSDSEISSGSSVLSSPPRFNSMETASPSSFGTLFMQEITPTHLSSRTRKRFRDNRPSDAAIHQNTLSMLFNAQKNVASSPIAPHEAVVNPMPSPHHQVSLHSFWAIPNQPSSSTSSSASYSPPSTSHILNAATNCEDCNSTLASPDSDAMDVDMDIDVYANDGNYACEMCGKAVCHQCAVSNMGAQRRCLICAGKRQWVGGLGWIDSD